jgi:hypothetical protein
VGLLHLGLAMLCEVSLSLKDDLTVREKANLAPRASIWRLTSLMAVRLAAVATTKLGASVAPICGDDRVVEASAIWVSLG